MIMNRRVANILIGLVVFLICPLCWAQNSALGQEVPKKIPVTVKGDKLDYDRTADVYVAAGNVKIEQEGVMLEADKVVLDNKTGEAVAEGKVYLREKGDILRADKLQINLNTGAGIIYNGELFMRKDNYHLKGEKIEKRSETVYRIENGTFTTCDDGAWYLKADEINVDMDRYATGSNVSFNMIGLPVLYTPYLLFPVRRQSGLLMPEVGHSNRDGFLMKNAVFWAISDYQDMTLYSDYRERRGHGTGIEYRYVNSRDSAGKAYYNYFDTLDSTERRWELKFQHAEEFAEDLSGRVDINLVSDPLYFRDLEKKLDLWSRPYLDSNAFYVERWDTAALYLIGQYSTNLTQANVKTIQKLPELRYHIFQEKIAGPVYLGFAGSAVNFTVREGDGVRRADFNPRLAAVIGGSGFNLTPRLGGHATFYDRSYDQATKTITAVPTDLNYYYAGADLNFRISRVYGSDGDAGIGKIRHSIEPTVSYDYIPHVDKETLPQLDSIEQVNSKNFVTVALISRVTAHYREGDRFRTFDMTVFRLSQSYDVLEAKNKPAAEAHPRSEIRGEVFFRTPNVLSLSATGNYNTYTDNWSSSSESVNVKGGVISLDVTHQYLRKTELAQRTEFLIGGTTVKLGSWNLHAQVWRDVVNKKTTQQEYGANYFSQCWGLGVSYITRPTETQYLLMFGLKGLGMLKL